MSRRPGRPLRSRRGDEDGDPGGGDDRIAGTVRRALPVVCVAALLVLAGCSGILGGEDGSTPTATTDGPVETTTETTTESTTTTTTITTTSTTTTTAQEDRIGWEDGYSHDDPLSVTPEDGFNDSEFEALTARTMARVELIRNREYDGNVEIEFVTREQLRENSPFSFGQDPYRDQFWEALFVVGENRTTAAALNDLYGVVVDGYATRDRVVIVAENPDSPRIDPAVLSHELAHILGGPRLDARFRGATADQLLVIRSVREGNANFVETQYSRRCETEWDCVERPPGAGEVEEFEDVNLGLFLWFAAPYTVGEELFFHQFERGGIDAIDRIYADPPSSMEEVLHPTRYPGEEPTEVTVPDRSESEWQRIRSRRGIETQTYGEAILYSALKANGVIGGPEPEINEAQRTGLNYTDPVVDGWTGDSFVAYGNGTDGAYVFTSTWESPEDAREFREAYLELIESRGGTQVEGDVYRIESGAYADAFRVTRDGNRVVVVNAPTVEDLSEVHPEDEAG